MNRAEFLSELERLLSNVPENERLEALKYYEEYFADAGEENEQKVIAELESPQKIADKIKDDLRADMDFMPGGQNSAWQSGTAYQNGTSYQGNTIYQGNTFYQNSTPKDTKESMPAWAIVLIVLGCIIASPLILGAAGALFGILTGLFAGLLGVIVGFGAGGIGLLVGGISLVFCGFLDLLVAPYAAALLLGAGLIMLALGILFIMFTVWLCGYVIPAACRGIARLWNKAFNKSK